MPDDSGDLAVNTRVHSTHYLAHEAAGALGTRHSPRPLFRGRNISVKPRAHRVARMRTWISASLRAQQSMAQQKVKSGLLRFARNDVPHSPPSSPAHAGDPERRVGKAKRAHHPSVQIGYGGHGARAPLPTLRNHGDDDWSKAKSPHTVPSTTTSISFAPGRLNADASIDFKSPASVIRIASSPSDLATPVKSTFGSTKSMPT
jgi:hypothetical protein